MYLQRIETIVAAREEGLPDVTVEVWQSVANRSVNKQEMIDGLENGSLLIATEQEQVVPALATTTDLRASSWAGHPAEITQVAAIATEYTQSRRVATHFAVLHGGVYVAQPEHLDADTVEALGAFYVSDYGEDMIDELPKLSCRRKRPSWRLAESSDYEWPDPDARRHVFGQRRRFYPGWKEKLLDWWLCRHVPGFRARSEAARKAAAANRVRGISQEDMRRCLSAISSQLATSAVRVKDWGRRLWASSQTLRYLSESIGELRLRYGRDAHCYLPAFIALAKGFEEAPAASRKTLLRFDHQYGQLLADWFEQELRRPKLRAILRNDMSPDELCDPNTEHLEPITIQQARRRAIAAGNHRRYYTGVYWSWQAQRIAASLPTRIDLPHYESISCRVVLPERARDVPWRKLFTDGCPLQQVAEEQVAESASVGHQKGPRLYDQTEPLDGEVYDQVQSQVDTGSWAGQSYQGTPKDGANPFFTAWEETVAQAEGSS